MSEENSQRRILWATSVVGGATLGILVVAIVRNKAVALAGGVEAVGLLGLYTTVLATVAAFATFGLDYSSTRLLAPRVDQPREAAAARFSIWIAALITATVGASTLWLFRAFVAKSVVGNVNVAEDIGWLSAGVAASVFLAVQLAIMQSYGRVQEASKVRLWGSVLSAPIAIIAVVKLNMGGVVIAVLALPLTSCLLALVMSGALRRNRLHRPSASKWIEHSASLFAIGSAVALTQAVGNVSGLGGRAIVTQELGLSEAGIYHAANAVVTMNVTLLLNAIAMDFFPRVSRIIEDDRAANALLNEQLRVMFMLGAPVLIFICAAAPAILEILYSSQFTGGAFLLRLFLIGSAVRVAAWVLSFTILARGLALPYFTGEAAGLSFVVAVWLLVPRIGLDGAGYAAIIGVVATLAVYQATLVRRGLGLNAENKRELLLLVASLSWITFAFQQNVWLGLLSAIVIGGWSGWRSLRDLRGILRR